MAPEPALGLSDLVPRGKSEGVLPIVILLMPFAVLELDVSGFLSRSSFNFPQESEKKADSAAGNTESLASG